MLLEKHKRNKTQKKKKNSSNPVNLREEGRERGNWVQSRGEIARQRGRRDHAAEATRFDLEARLRGEGEGKHDQT